MKHRVRDWCRPIQPRILLALAALWLIAGVASTADAYRWAPPTWVHMSVALREGSLVPGVASAMVAAGYAGSMRWRSLIGGPGRARSGWPTVRRQVSRLVFVSLASAVLAQVPALITTTVRASAGHVDLLALVDGYLVIAGWTVFGYAVGAVVPGMWGALVAGILAFIVGVLPEFLGSVTSIYSIAPVWLLDWPYLGDQLSPFPEVFRVLFFALGLVVALNFSTRILDRQITSQFRTSARASAAFVPVLILAVASVGQQPLLVQPEKNPPIICESEKTVTVCMHKGFQQLVGEAVKVSSREAEIRGSTGRIVVAEKSAAHEHPEADLTMYADLSSESGFVNKWASNTAYLLASGPNCRAGTGQSVNQEIASEAIAREITQRAGYQFISQVGTSNGEPMDQGQPLSKALHNMTTPEFTAWLTTHDHEIESCTVDPTK